MSQLTFEEINVIQNALFFYENKENQEQIQTIVNKLNQMEI